LLSNAFKFTSNGSVKVSVNLTDKEQLMIEVSDTGVGIASEKLDSIFDEFEQENSGVARLYGGSGLGLSIVKRLTNLLGGGVEVSSKKGEGSLFRLTLPYDSSKLQSSPNLNHYKKREDCSGDRTKKILLVEDNDINIKVFLKRLSNLGFEQVFVAKNGQFALDLLAVEKIDLIFMDVQMPVMDGLQATKSIRKGKAGAKIINIPIIGLSANSFDEDQKSGMEAGMDKYLSKPLKINELIQILNEYL